MRLRAVLFIALSVTSFVAGSVVRAQTVSTTTEPLIFQMANGQFFNPASGLSAPTRDQLLALLSATTTANPTTVPSATPTATTTSSSAPLIIQMANGSFYNPSSGLSAPTRDQLLALLSGTTSVTPSSAATATPANSSPSVSSTNSPPTFPLLTAIETAQAHLEQQAAATGTRIVKTDDGWRDVTLAVWHPDSDTLTYHDVMKNGFKVKATDLNLRVKDSNSLNSEFVVDGGKAVVVAVLYPVYEQVKVNGRKRYQVTPAVYTPYSQALDTPSLEAFGRTVFDGFVGNAYRSLDNSGVHSRAYPDRLMSGAVDPNLVKSIAIIEHSDQKTLAVNPAGAASIFFSTLGANRDHAYAFSKSSSGAQGIVQFMPATYKLLAKRPELGLIADPAQGASDPGNAVKAEVAYLDSLLATMPPQVRAEASTNQSTADEYLAAAYNAGEVRVKRAIETWGADWSSAGGGALTALKQKKPTLKNQITALQTKIKKQKDADLLAALKIKLAAAKSELALIDDRIAAGKNALLKSETLDYLLKFRHALAYVSSGEGSKVALAGSGLN